MSDNPLQFLLNLLSDENAQEQFQEDPEGYTANELPGGLSESELYDALPELCGQLPPEDAARVAESYGLVPGSDGGYSYPVDGPAGGGGGGTPPPAPQPGETPVESVMRHVTHINNVTEQRYVDNSVTNIDDRDTIVDASQNVNVNAFGSDVDIDLDNETNTASGDGAVAGVEGSQVQTGDGVQVGGDANGDIVTGDGNATGEGSFVGDGNIAGNEGPVTTGSGNTVLDGSYVDDSVIGDGNQTVNADGDASGVGFGEGEVTNVGDVGGDVGAIGDGNVQTGDIGGNANIGGEQTVDETNIDAGGDLAYGAGADASDTDVTYDPSGSTQLNVGDGDVSQSAEVDQSADTTTVDNSNNSVNNSYNTNENTEVDTTVATDVDGSVHDNYTSTYDDSGDYESADIADDHSVAEVQETTTQVEDIDMAG